MLKESTLKRYSRSALLERDDSGRPIYFHSARCPSFCDFGCNVSGSEIADAIEKRESKKAKRKLRLPI